MSNSQNGPNARWLIECRDVFEALEMVLGVLLGGVGLFLLIDGWRGQRIGREPRCRKCGYSLIGRVEGHDRCPECGSWLDLSGAVLYGDKRRRPKRLLLGLTVLLLATGWLVMRTAASLEMIDVMSHKPTWWLFNDMKADSYRATGELCKRLVARKLSQAQIDRITDWVLAKQADRQGLWVDDWADFVETSHRCGLIDQARWERYIRQGYAVQVRIRPVVRAGDALPVEWRVGPLRLSTAMPSLRTFVLTAKTGELVGYDQVLTSLIPGFGTTHEGEPEVGLATTTGMARLGRRKVVLQWETTAGGLGSVLTKLVDSQSLECEVTDKSAVGVNRPELRKAIIDGLSAETRSAQRITLIANNPPMDLAFDLWIPYPGKDASCVLFGSSGHVVFRKGTWTRTTIDCNPDFSAAPDTTLRMTLRPNAAVAAQTIDIREYWDGDAIVIDNINLSPRVIGQ